MKIAHAWISIPAVAAVMLIAGCAGSRSSPSLFLLDSDTTTAPVVPIPSGAPTVVVDQVVTAPYLDQGGIVYQTAPHRVVIANNNRWASPLSGELTDGLYAALDERADGFKTARSGQSSSASALHLKTQVSEFLGHYDGSAHVAGQWSLLMPDGRRLAGDTFNTRIALARDGYPALVASLSHGWQQTSQAIARAVGKAVAAKKPADTVPGNPR